VHVAAKVPPQLADDFRAQAQAEDRTVSSLLRVAMRRCLNEKRPRPGRVETSKTAGTGRNDAG
jgi:hypothetical protein